MTRLKTSQKKDPTHSAPDWKAAPLSKDLVAWFQGAKRDLPWRKNKDPYRIWISEVMLQQTTVTAVIPYFEKFTLNFPTVDALANSPIEQVLHLWSGLGYYSRARNLHKAAQLFSQTGFPKSYQELLNYPGLGPYTARAVSSIAFDEPVGVLDGNVIRVLSRVRGASIEHWKPQGRALLQTWADELAKHQTPSWLNQALMELGATICTPQSPACFVCPWLQSCQARKMNAVAKLPLKKPRRAHEIWVWQPEIMIRKKSVALVQNAELPFLKGHLVFPGKIALSKTKPKKFDLKHGITHHDIYVQIRRSTATKTKLARNAQWVLIDNLKSVSPSKLLQKILEHS
jgi:A/G-specific adenine glycosylase